MAEGVHSIADGGRQNVLGVDLNDTGTICLRHRQQHSEIQVVRENDPGVGRGEIEDLGISRPRWTNRRPVDCLESLVGQEGNPQRAQDSYRSEIHAAGSGTSISSTRHAAYANA